MINSEEKGIFQVEEIVYKNFIVRTDQHVPRTHEGLYGCRAVTQEEKSVQSLDLVGSVRVFSFLIS